MNKNEEYAKKLDELMTDKTELKDEAHKCYNAGWKLMNQFRFAKNLAAKKEGEITKLVASFKGIKYTKKEGRSLEKLREEV